MWHLARELTQDKSVAARRCWRGVWGTVSAGSPGQPLPGVASSRSDAPSLPALLAGARGGSTRRSGDPGASLAHHFRRAGEESKAQRKERICPEPHSGQKLGLAFPIPGSGRGRGRGDTWGGPPADARLFLVQSSSINQQTGGSEMRPKCTGAACDIPAQT